MAHGDTLGSCDGDDGGSDTDSGSDSGSDNGDDPGSDTGDGVGSDTGSGDEPQVDPDPGTDAGSDPASVAYKTATYAKEKGIDLALIDTAGRMQNKKNLMDEYKKIFNVLKKIDQSFPNETILVLDATTGQNALNQVEEFTKIHNITGY